jgi:hypothetical protein
MKKILLVILAILFTVSVGCIGTSNSGRGKIEITSTPLGVEVYLDNQYKGTTPNTLADVPSGNHIIELRKNDYQTWSKNISISSESLLIDASLTPISKQTSEIITTIPPTSKSYVVAATVSQSGTNIIVTWQGGSDNARCSGYNVFIGDVFTPQLQNAPCTVGKATSFPGLGTSGQDHVIVSAAFTDGVRLVVMDTYV